jgi:outer membrane receptor for ferrienterochelin and colicins
MKRAIAAKLALAAALAAPGAAAADDVADLAGLLDQPVVSTASKAAESAREAPATVSTVTADDLRRYGVRTLAEAFNFLALGLVAMDTGHHDEVGARGALFSVDYGNHVLLLVDGHMVNEPSGGTAYFDRGAGVPLELIDHVEIVLGPGSVLYGSNAMLAVVNVVTKRAKDFGGVRLVAEAEVATTLRAAVGAGHEFELFGQRAEFVAQAEYFAREGPSYSFGPQTYGDDWVTGEPKRFRAGEPGTGVWGGVARRSNYARVPSGYARLRWGDFELGARAVSFRRGSPFLNTVTNVAGDFDERPNGETDTYLSLDLKHRATLGVGTELRTRLYADGYRYLWDNNTSAAENCPEAYPGGCDRRSVFDSRVLGAEVQASHDWLRDGRLASLVGVDARLRHVDVSSRVGERGTGANPDVDRYYDATERYAGVYAQQVVRPWAGLSLNAGARLDADGRFGSHLSPRLAVTYSPAADHTLKALYAEAFRGPTAYETSYSDPNYSVASPSLRPETVRSWEVSSEQRFGRQRLLFGAFRTTWSDMIAFRTLGEGELAAAIERGELSSTATTGAMFDNVAAVSSHGFNGTFDGALAEGRLRYGLNLTGAYTRRRDPDVPAVPMAGAPQFYGNARVSYEFGGGLPTAALAAHFYAPTRAVGALEGNPAYRASGQLVLRTTLSGAVPGVPGLSYRLTANYATASRGTYLVGPVQYTGDDPAKPEFSPVDRFRAALGLEYQFAP